MATSATAATNPTALDHVPESELGELHRTCPLCGFDGPRARMCKLQSAPDVWMASCPHCHAAAAERFAKPSFLAALYDPSRYSSSLAAEEALSNRCAARILRHFTPDRDAPIEIVDYGGNEGTLARSLREQLVERGHRGPIRGTVVDLYPAAGDEHLRFIDVETFAAEGVEYDLVVASAVLEHLTDLRDVIARLLASARPGALFYARTPYDLPLARLGLGYSIRWPRHLYDLGPAFWAGFLDTFGARGEMVVSRPSLVETTFSSAPLRTLAAHLLKAPAVCEARLRRPDRMQRPLWRLVGGWEVLIRLS